MSLLNELNYILFQADGILYWSARVLVLAALLLSFYHFFSHNLARLDFFRIFFIKNKENRNIFAKNKKNNNNKNIMDEKTGFSLKEEDEILKKLNILKKEENVLNKKKKAIKRQIDNIINRGIKLRKIEESIEPKKRIVEFQKISEKEKKTEEINKFLDIVDDLLGKLSEDEISKFSKSKDFTLYQKVLKHYRKS